LPEYYRSFVFLEKGMLADVFEEIALAQQLCDDINLLASDVLLDELDYVGMVALFEDPNLSLQDFSFTFFQFFGLDHLDRHQITCLFLLASVNIRKITFADTLQPQILFKYWLLLIIC